MQDIFATTKTIKRFIKIDREGTIVELNSMLTATHGDDKLYPRHTLEITYPGTVFRKIYKTKAEVETALSTIWSHLGDNKDDV